MRGLTNLKFGFSGDANRAVCFWLIKKEKQLCLRPRPGTEFDDGIVLLRDW